MIESRTATGALTLLSVVCLAMPTDAHVKFTQNQVPLGKPVLTALVVGHGCSGSPTLRLRVRIPAGIVDVQPAAKPGWTTSVERARYPHAMSAGGRTFLDGVSEILWSGNLPPNVHGTFGLQFRLADDLHLHERILFPVVQECVHGVERWIDGSDDDENPAPALIVAPDR